MYSRVALLLVFFSLSLVAEGSVTGCASVLVDCPTKHANLTVARAPLGGKILKMVEDWNKVFKTRLALTYSCKLEHHVILALVNPGSPSDYIANYYKNKPHIYVQYTGEESNLFQKAARLWDIDGKTALLANIQYRHFRYFGCASIMRGSSSYVGCLFTQRE